MKSITTFDIQYAHRFYGFAGEARHLHGHTGRRRARRAGVLPEVRFLPERKGGLT